MALNVYAVPGKLRRKKKSKEETSVAMTSNVAKIHRPKVSLAKQIQADVVKAKEERFQGKRKAEEERASVEEEEAESTAVEADKDAVAPKKTKAELAFQKRQDELMGRRVIEKAQSSHREKVMKFNEHMDTLTEYNDIPKISWIK